MEIECCPECGIPKQIPDGHEWLDNGAIVHKGDPGLRMIFIESENLDPLFKGVERLIGTSIENIIIDAERKGNRDYFNPLIPREVKDMLRKHEISLDPIIEAMIHTAKVNGVGRYELKEYQHELRDDDHTTMTVYNTHCLPITCGDMAGGAEAVTEREHSKISYREVAPGAYEITTAVSGFEADLEGQLERKAYQLRTGDIELEKCGTCGGPVEFSKFEWVFEEGTIINPDIGRRIAIAHPSVMDSIFAAIEAELGSEIPRVVVEAQRLFTKTGFYRIEELDEKTLRGQLALRGIGNLREVRMDANGLRLQLDNACMPLMMVGMVQGLFELAYYVGSTVEWELSEEDDLRVEVKPKPLKTG
jgi:hypothetical protein